MRRYVILLCFCDVMSKGGEADLECFCFTGATMCELYELGRWEGGAGELGVLEGVFGSWRLWMVGGIVYT